MRYKAKTKRKVEIGDKFGLRTVLELERVKGRKMALTRCDCGEEKYVRTDLLLRGLRVKCLMCSSVKHGMLNTGTWTSWKSMHGRCNDVGRHNYHRYGGRGIKVAARWGDFKSFYEDMGDRPEGFTIDRVDNNGDYTPENCRWISHAEQHRNKSTTKLNAVAVKVIRLLHSKGFSNARLARAHSVNPTTIRNIVNNISWEGV